MSRPSPLLHMHPGQRWPPGASRAFGNDPLSLPLVCLRLVICFSVIDVFDNDDSRDKNRPQRLTITASRQLRKVAGVQVFLSSKESRCGMRPTAKKCGLGEKCQKINACREIISTDSKSLEYVYFITSLSSSEDFIWLWVLRLLECAPVVTLTDCFWIFTFPGQPGF